ncbi:MAG: hypothetical protein K6E13_09690 [Lachnospiraceae bacterium]|nr:hypothetical protein [Lachnospiraceae bacterium]
MDASDMAAKLVADRVDNYFVQKRVAERRHKKMVEEHHKEMAQKRRALIFMIFCVLLLCLSSLSVVYLNYEVTRRSENVASMQSELARIKEDNDAKERSYVCAMNYAELKSKATSLGMSQTSGDQIVYFSVDEDDYMEQRGDIE